MKKMKMMRKITRMTESGRRRHFCPDVRCAPNVKEKKTDLQIQLGDGEGPLRAAFALAYIAFLYFTYISLA